MCITHSFDVGVAAKPARASATTRRRKVFYFAIPLYSQLTNVTGAASNHTKHRRLYKCDCVIMCVFEYGGSMYEELNSENPIWLYLTGSHNYRDLISSGKKGSRMNQRQIRLSLIAHIKSGELRRWIECSLWKEGTFSLEVLRVIHTQYYCRLGLNCLSKRTMYLHGKPMHYFMILNMICSTVRSIASPARRFWGNRVYIYSTGWSSWGGERGVKEVVGCNWWRSSEIVLARRALRDRWPPWHPLIICRVMPCRYKALHKSFSPRARSP
jgi:hypothetical protein